jgi:hypothetical protein
MNLIRTRSFLSSFVLLTASASAYTLSACSSDDDNNNGNDGGNGGNYSTGGKSSTGGKTGSGGSGTGASTSTGGSGAGGTGAGGTGGNGTGATTATGGYGPDSGTDGGGTDGGGGADSGEPGPTEGAVRIVHAATAAPNVDIYRKGSTTALAKNVAYGDSTGYLTVDAGTYQFEVRAAGAAATSTAAFTTPTIAIKGGTKYTAVAAGNLASSDTADRFRILPLEEGFGANAAGKTRARLVHASYDGPATVSVDVGNDDAAHAEVTDLARFGVSDAEGTVLDSGAHVQIGVAVPGNPDPVVLTAFTTPELPSGKDVFIIAAGSVAKFARDPLGLQAIVVYPDSTTELIKQNPRIWALHASPDAGPVDIFVGTKEVVDYEAFGQLALTQVAPGAAVKLDFFAGTSGKTARPAGDPVASGSTPALDAGNSYLAVAAGTVTGTPTFSLITAAEGFDAGTATQARIRAIHASADSPAIDLGTVTTAGTLASAIFTNAKYKDVTPVAGTNVAVGALTLGIAPTGTTSTLADFAVTTTANERAFVVAAGKYTGTPNPLQLLVVNTSGLLWGVEAITKN